MPEAPQGRTLGEDEGPPGGDVPLSVHNRRFHHSLTDHRRWIRERSHEAYAKNYSIVFPHDEPLAGRNMRTDPLHEVPQPHAPALGWLRRPWGGPGCGATACTRHPGCRAREVSRWLVRSRHLRVKRAWSRIAGGGARGQVCAATGQEAEPGGSLPGPSVLLTNFYLYNETHRQVPFPATCPSALCQAPSTQLCAPVPITPIPSPSPASSSSSWAACFAYQSSRTQPAGGWACLWVQSLTLDRCSGDARPLDGWSGRQAAGSVSRSHL